MRGKSIVSLSLVLVLVSVMMMGIQPVDANPYEYELYVDDFKPWMSQWDVSGASPWLDAIDSSYIEGTFHLALMGNFTFEDINLPPCEVITKVVLEGYTNGPYTYDVDYDVFTLPDVVWLGSLYATGAPAWVTPRWVWGAPASDLDPTLLTEEGINNLQLVVLFYDPAGLGGTGNIIDALRLKVYTAISATIDFIPRTINNNTGLQFLTCKITLPYGFSASGIDQSSILLDRVIAPSWFDTPIGSTLKVGFNMTDVKTYIDVEFIQGVPVPPGGIDVLLTVTFNLTDGKPFQGSETVKYIVP